MTVFLESDSPAAEIEREVRLVLRTFYWDHGVMCSNFLSHLFHSYLDLDMQVIFKQYL